MPAAMKATRRGSLLSASWISSQIQESIATKIALGEHCLSTIGQIAVTIAQALKDGKKVLIFGNGGSAADSQHIAAELVGWYFARERKAFPAIALSTDTSVLTAIANDSTFEEVFARQISALGNPEDVALAISTSGDSRNVIRAVEVARSLSMVTIGLTGLSGGKMKALLHTCLCVPSNVIPRIQEAHILVGHIICAAVERLVLEATTSAD